MNVIIKPIDGFNFTLTVNKDDTIEELKKKIEEFNGFSPSQQKLFFNDKVLINNEKLFTYGLKDGSDVGLFLYPREFNLKIHVQNDNILDFTVKPSDDIMSIKKQIQTRISMHVDEQLLLYQAEELIGNRLLSEYNILDTCCLKLIPKLREFNLKIHVQNDNIFELSVKSCDDIMSIKKQIQTRISMHVDEQLLLYQGEELMENRVLSEYNILDTCCLKLNSKLGNKVDFIINFLDKPKLPLTITSNRTVFDIKCMLQDELGILPAEQRLIMNCRILEDNEIVSECLRNEKIVINLIHQKRMGFQIFVKNLSGSYFSLEVDKNEKIIDIKRKIENIRGWKAEDQKIVFRGKTLNNEEIIDNCAFEWNSIIYVKK